MPRKGPRAGGSEIRVVGGVESLDEVATLIQADSILLFNLTGIPIDAYNVGGGDQERLAANIVDALTSLRRSNLPVEAIIMRDGAEAYIFPVTSVGGMEVYALITGKMAMDVEEARSLLKNYVETIISSVG